MICERCGTVFCVDLESDAYWLSRSRRRHCSKACRNRCRPSDRRHRRELNQRPDKVRRQVRILRERDGDNCWLCQAPIDFTITDINDPMRRSRDHVIPRALGGSLSLANMRLAHRKCNAERKLARYRPSGSAGVADLPGGPRCAVHGPMRYRAAGHWWTCPGWDGEGCCALEAERLTEDTMVVMPAPGSQPSQWGARAAIPAGQNVEQAKSVDMPRPAGL